MEELAVNNNALLQWMVECSESKPLSVDYWFLPTPGMKSAQTSTDSRPWDTAAKDPDNVALYQLGERCNSNITSRFQTHRWDSHICTSVSQSGNEMIRCDTLFYYHHLVSDMATFVLKREVKLIIKIIIIIIHIFSWSSAMSLFYSSRDFLSSIHSN